MGDTFIAEAMGAQFIVYTAKHGDGFCMWQTDTTDFGVKDTPWRGGKGDILADLSESCRKRGMKLGIYINATSLLHQAGGGGKTDDAKDQERYSRIYRQQLIEVLSRYGDIFEVWFDGGCSIEVGDILQKHTPNAMVFGSPAMTIRWVGNEQGVAPYPAWNACKTSVTHGTEQAHPDGPYWLPIECDARIRASWMFQEDNVHTLKSVDELMDMYDKSVGRGAVLLLNNTPDTTGRIPEADAARSAQFGAEIRRRFAQSIAETAGKGPLVELELEAPATIDHVILMEDIRFGERVRQYPVEGWSQGAWHALCTGSAIGHKRIHRFPAAQVDKLRLRILESVAPPLIRKLAVYNGAATQKNDPKPLDNPKPSR